MSPLPTWTADDRILGRLGCRPGTPDGRETVSGRGRLAMRAVMPSVPPEILEWRKRTGAHQWDEMWNGVLHIMPSPNNEHQDLEGSLELFLRLYWARRCRAKVYHNAN